jgi:PTS system mannose-specific IIC component
MPLGKMGQLFERWARDWNGRLLQKAQDALEEGRFRAAEQVHLWGVVHFALASLATFATIVVVGSLLLSELGPILLRPATDAAPWLRVAFPIMGTAIILSSINVRRSLTLFAASFTSALLMLWLL